MGDLELTIAGAMTLRHGDAVFDDDAFRGRQLRLVTAMLLVDRADPVPVDRLVGELWPTGPPEQFRPALRGLVSKVRRLLADAGIDGDRIHSNLGSYAVGLPDLRVDVESAVAALATARALADAGDLARAQDVGNSARTVLSRPIMPGVDADWADALRDRMAHHHLESLLLLGRCRHRQGRTEAARTIAREAITMAPLREDAWRLAMRIEADAGNAAGALHLYDAVRGHLSEELGIDPSAATQDLHTSILLDVPNPGTYAVASHARKDPNRSAPDNSGDRIRARGMPAGGIRSLETRPEAVPYVGLRAFDTSDADWFFGREAVTQALLRRLARHRAVAVVGPSGVGKSSLVRAGLLPALAHGGLPDSDTWQPVVITPGAHPLRALAIALADVAASDVDPASLEARLSSDPRGLHQYLATRRAGREQTTLLVVDQAEELFTLADRAEADALVEALATTVAAASPHLVLALTMRADFYERATRQPRLAGLLSRSQFVMPPLRGDGLQLAITSPARRAGIHLEDGVLGRLVAEVGTNASGLPLLQHALWELWEHRDGGLLTLAALDRLGGVAGALANHAEAVWQDLDDGRRHIARSLLLRGVAASAQGTTAVPIHRDDIEGLGPARDVAAVVAALVDARLLTAASEQGTGQSLLQLSHESVVEAWPRMREWVEAQRAQLSVARRLTTAAQQWSDQGRHTDWLLRGQRLHDAQLLATTIANGSPDIGLSKVERAFIEASTAAQERADRRREERRQRERRLHLQGLRRLTTALALSSAENVVDRDPELALLLALDVADDIHEELEPNWLRLLHHALGQHRLLARLPNVGPILQVLPNQRLVTLGPPDEDGLRAVVLRDADGGHVTDVVEGACHPSPPQVAVTSDGRHFAIGSHTGEVDLRDESLRRVGLLEGPEAQVGALAIAPDGLLVAGLWLRGRTRQLVVYDTETGAIVHRRAPLLHEFANMPFEHDHQVAFHPTAPRLAVVAGPAHADLQVLDTSSWDIVAAHQIRPTVRWIDFSPDGRWLGVAHRYGISVHDATTLSLQRTLRTRAKLPAATWSGDSRELVAAGSTLRRLDVRGPEATAMPPLPDTTARLTEDAADRTVFTLGTRPEVVTGRRGSDDLQRWDVAPTRATELARIMTDQHAGGGVAWSPDGAMLAVAPGRGWVAIHDVSSWREIARFRATGAQAGPHRPPHVDNITWSTDGQDIVTMGTGGVLHAHDVAAGRTRFSRSLPLAYSAGDADVSHDGRFIAAASGSHIEVVDRDGVTAATMQSPHGSLVEAIWFSPDDTLLATTHWPTGVDRPGAMGVTVWDWRGRDVVTHLDGLANNLSFDTRTGFLAVAGDGRTTIWDLHGNTVVDHLVGHRGLVQDVAHHPNGDLVATCGWDGALRLWDRTGASVLHVSGLHRLHRVRFHPDRPWIAINESPGAVHVWTLDRDELIAIVRRRVTRELTVQERRHHLGSPVIA